MHCLVLGLFSIPSLFAWLWLFTGVPILYSSRYIGQIIVVGFFFIPRMTIFGFLHPGYSSLPEFKLCDRTSSPIKSILNGFSHWYCTLQEIHNEDAAPRRVSHPPVKNFAQRASNMRLRHDVDVLIGPWNPSRTIYSMYVDGSHWLNEAIKSNHDKSMPLFSLVPSLVPCSM